MQAYARAEAVQATPDFKQQVTGRRDAAAGITANPRLGSRPDASSAITAALLDGLDANALGLLAERLAPHLARLEGRKLAVAHVAFTVHSLASELGVSSKAIRCAIARGELNAVKRGSRWIISADAVDEWATPTAPRGTAGPKCWPRVPKTAGPSLRSVLCARHRGGAR